MASTMAAVDRRSVTCRRSVAADRQSTQHLISQSIRQQGPYKQNNGQTIERKTTTSKQRNNMKNQNSIDNLQDIFTISLEQNETRR